MSNWSRSSSSSYSRNAKCKKGNKLSGLFTLFATVCFIAYCFGLSASSIFDLTVYGLVILVAIFIIKQVTNILLWCLNTYRRKKLNFIEVKQMSGIEFEKYVAMLLKIQGFSHIELTEHYDLGIDIIAYKNDIKWGIQVKRYGSMVGLEAVRQVVTALNHYSCDKAMVITNNIFSGPAKILAKSNDCVLIEGKELVKWYLYSRAESPKTTTKVPITPNFKL